jgi:glycosyltransferase involved in cell wall biosynthesis
MDPACRYSVVVPCYRSADSLPALIPAVVKELGQTGASFEVILVNDASLDTTWDVIVQLARQHAPVRGIDLFVNVGQFRSTLCGLSQARGEYIITMDDDGQHPATQIRKLIDAIERQPELDCVIGVPSERRDSLVRQVASSLRCKLQQHLFGHSAGVKLTSFRIMHKTVAECLCRFRQTNPVIGDLLLKTTRRIDCVTVEHSPRQHGASGYGILGLAAILVNQILYHSTIPFRTLSLSGLAALASVLAVAAFAVARQKVPEWVTLPVVLIVFFGGAGLLAAGLLGEYLFRILTELSRAEDPFIRRRVNAAAGDVPSVLRPAGGRE